MQSKGLFYLAHPYTCKDKDGKYVPEGEDANFQLANYRAGQCLLRGYNIYSPISHTHPIHRATVEFLARHEHEAWYQLDIDFIAKTKFDGIILCPGYEKSRGCLLEKQWFVDRGLPVLYFTDIIEANRCV